MKQLDFVTGMTMIFGIIALVAIAINIWLSTKWGKKWLKTFVRRFFNQQFKRSCLPDGPKVGSVSLSPRGDWRMPSDATSTIWLQEAESL